MASQNPSYTTDTVAEKVLRRAEIAKVARNLQDRLALANFKAQNGWQNRTLRNIEPEVTEQLRRKRPYSSGDGLSDSASNTSEEYLYYNSSPLTGPAFSDEILASSYSRSSHPKEPPFKTVQNSGSRKRFRSSSNVAPLRPAIGNKAWKQTHHLAQSSPIFQRPSLPFSNMNQSFVSDAAIIPESRHLRSSRFASQSSLRDDQNDLPAHSFNHQQKSPTLIASSPPRTPSPTHLRTRKHHSKETGADLLLYLANSPSRSPAVRPSHRTINSSHLEPPSTPPSQQTSTTTTSTSKNKPNDHEDDNNNLPSSFLSTPNTSGTHNLPLFSTPGQQFNFADFVNVTPSPAQAPWGGRTPGTINRTPAAARAARRGLNFDALVPPPNGTTGIRNGSFSPVLQRGERKVGKGLALELGDRLMPRS